MLFFDVISSDTVLTILSCTAFSFTQAVVTDPFFVKGIMSAMKISNSFFIKIYINQIICLFPQSINTIKSWLLKNVINIFWFFFEGIEQEGGGSIAEAGFYEI